MKGSQIIDDMSPLRYGLIVFKYENSKKTGSRRNSEYDNMYNKIQHVTTYGTSNK